MHRNFRITEPYNLSLNARLILLSRDTNRRNASL